MKTEKCLRCNKFKNNKSNRQQNAKKRARLVTVTVEYQMITLPGEHSIGVVYQKKGLCNWH